tara:strand:- start:243 stop:1880 length:1638 start_codon:yes stop_codon:yes gene_type:complete
MKSYNFSYRNVNRTSQLFNDYVEGASELKSFYNLRPNLNNFKIQLNLKSKNYIKQNRDTLYSVINDQYKSIKNLNNSVKKNIELLKLDNTYTVCTGHQLTLLTGPIYFIYKIISTINLTKILNKKYPEFNFIPIFWMATEDHDFDEISSFNFNGVNYKWNKKKSGPVGLLDIKGLERVFDLFFEKLEKDNLNSKYLIELVKDSYLKSSNLADATRKLVNTIFGNKGIVIIDSNEKRLKKIFEPYLLEEIRNKTSNRIINSTIENLKKKYGKSFKAQVNPREINLFYQTKTNRERIVIEKNFYKIKNSNINYDLDGIKKILKTNPEFFSPNVLLRPLYQETILPNICYIGGPSEISYWLLLKDFFDSQNVNYPILLNRNSALIIDFKLSKKIKNLNIDLKDLFMEKNSLINKKVREISNIDLDLSFLKNKLDKQFKYLNELVEKTDYSFKGSVDSEFKKQTASINKLEKRLLKAQRKKLSDHVSRLSVIYEKLFPNGSIQERKVNFTTFFQIYGEQFINELFKILDPLSNKFDVIIFDEEIGNKNV